MTNSIQTFIDTLREKYQIPGLSVSIFPAGGSQKDYVSGTTTINGSIPLQTNHLFQIGSITKTFIAALLLQLEAGNILSMNSYIHKWIQTPSDWVSITIKQLLNHTSGIYNYTDTFDEIMKTDQNIDFDKQWSTVELIDLAKLKPLYFNPGENWHYSNSNYLIAALIIEVATGNSISQELESRFFSSLNMHNTYYHPKKMNSQMINQMAHGYSKRNYFRQEPADITTYNLSWASAGGAIISTAHDTAIWFRKLFEGSLLPTKQMSDLMTAVPMKTDFPLCTSLDGYGLGIQRDFTSVGEWWGHSGGTLGYTALACWHKAVNTVTAITANQIGTDREVYWINQELIQKLYR